MRLTETLKTQPINVQRSVRQDVVRGLTSAHAGKIIPLHYVPMLREDTLTRGKYRIKFDMMETAEMLMNGVNVTVYAHFVPFLAFERFNGMDALNRSYKGIPETEGGTPIPFFETVPYKMADEFWRALGIHARAENHPVNSAPLEAYNCVVNYRRQARSTKLPLRDKNTTTLARAFWKNTTMSHIVPDFDQAKIDGEVPLNVQSGLLPVKGLASSQQGNGFQQWTAAENIRAVGGDVDENGGKWKKIGDTHGSDALYLFEDPAKPGYPLVFAELEQQGITVSLANIEMAKKTAAFANLREQFQGHDDDYIIDLLMSGIRVPDEEMSRPLLLARKSTIMGYNTRYATDAGNLDVSATNGETYIDVTVRTPQMNTGGVMILTAEIVPEQIFERQEDPFLSITETDKLPEFIRDYLDPEKVDVVKNEFVDTKHSDPEGIFGYAPLNHQWKRNLARIGGKYMRPDTALPFDENRQKIWSVESEDPALTEDFYLVNELHTKVFSDTVSEPFEILTLGRNDIIGNTVFGKGLQEATDDYDQIMEHVDTTRIVKPDTN